MSITKHIRLTVKRPDGQLKAIILPVGFIFFAEHTDNRTRVHEIGMGDEQCWLVEESVGYIQEELTRLGAM